MSMGDIPVMLRHLGRLLLRGHPQAPAVDMAGKKIIVTGASPGSLGYATAKVLASWGATVIITSRRQAADTAKQLRAELNRGGVRADVDAHDLDLTVPLSVSAFVRWYVQAYGEQLHVLINNAGVHLDLLGKWQQPQLSADGYEIHWRTNYLGPLQLTHLLLPVLRKTGREEGDARVLFVASHLHHRGLNSEFFQPRRPYQSWDAYGQSKLALLHSAFEIERRFGTADHLHGYVLHPGSIHSNIADSGLANSPLLRRLRGLFAPLEASILLSPLQGAQTSLLCATRPGLQGGHYYERCTLGRVSQEANDQHAAARLWQQTETWLAQLTPPLKSTALEH